MTTGGGRCLSRSVRALATVLVTGALIASGCSSRPAEELAETYGGAWIQLDPSPHTDPADPEPTDPEPEPELDFSDYEPTPDPEPIPLDERLMTGTLANGLQYFLRENDSPGGAIDLRLVVNAGSAQQADPDDGVAHFLEHMLFNGTERFPGNELDRALQGLGIQFGADLNAYTSYDETVYSLTAPTTDSTAVITAFDVLFEWASAATIDPIEVAAERGVVRDERRQSRESVDGIIFSEFEAIYTTGTPYEGRAVIGSNEEIDSTTADELREFYDRWYRPDNMAVVVVGDMDVEVMADLVEERFGTLQARGDDHPSRTEIQVQPESEARANQIIHPENLVDNLSLDWQLPVWDQGTVGGAELAVWERLIGSMATARLSDAWFAGQLSTDFQPYLSPFALNRELHYIGTNLRAPDLGVALQEYLGVMLDIVDTGFTEDEVADAVAAFTAELDAAEVALDSVQDSTFADNLTQQFLVGAGAEHPKSAIERQRSILDGVSRAGLSAHFTWILATSGPIMISVGADATTLPSPEALLGVAEAAIAIETAGSDPDIQSLMIEPSPVEPTGSDSFNGEYGTISTWDFANGATVVFERTRITAGHVEVATESEGGSSVLEPGAGALVELATIAVSNSGLGSASAAQVSQYLGSTTVDITPYIGAETEGFSGAAASDDLRTLFEVLHLSVTAPRVDQTALNEVRNYAAVLQDAAASDPSYQASEALAELWYGNDYYRRTPTSEQIDSITADGLLELYVSRLGSVDDMVVSVVGDVRTSVVADLASRYIGTLPPGEPSTFVDRMTPIGADEASIAVDLADGTDNGGIVMLWLDERPNTGQDAATAQLLETILSTRILDTVREDLGASYGGFASVTGIRRPRELLQGHIAVDGDPARLDEIRSTVLTQIDELATEGPSADEFARALAVLTDDFTYLNNRLLLLQNLNGGRGITDTLTTYNRHELLAAVTPGDVQQMTSEVFALQNYREVIRR